MEGEDAESAAKLGTAEGGGFGFGERAEFAGAAFDDLRRDLIGVRGGFGAGAGGIGEDVKIGEGTLFDEGESGGVIGIGFTWEAGDDVGADGGVGEAVVDQLDAAGVVLGAIPAVHGGENAVRGGLERHVEVFGHAAGAGEEFDEILRDVLRLDGADAEPFEGSFVQDAAEQIDELDAGRKIAAVSAQVDAGEHDFAGASFGKCLDFADDFIRRKAAGFAANKRDDAEGAAIVATVLDFEDGASVAGFAALNGRGEELGMGEDVAGEDVGGWRQIGGMVIEGGLTGPGWACPQDGVGRNVKMGRSS